MSAEAKNGKHPGYKRWVTFYVLLAIVVHVGVFYLFKLNLVDSPPAPKKEGFVYYLPEELPTASNELEERAFLFDSEPIFLPTSRNFSGPIKTDASIWEPELSLSSAFPAEIRWEDSLLVIEPDEEPGSESPLELLEVVSRDFVSEFGAQPRKLGKPSKPGLFVEAKNPVGDLFLKTFIQLENELDLEFPYNPEFSVLQTNYGLVGDPLLIQPSGSEETDNFVREFIIEKVHPLLLGTNGYFHIRIGL